MRGSSPFRGCVYLIGFKQSHKVYIGSSFKCQVRRSQHLNQLRKGKHINTHLQRAYNKYGEDSMVFEILESFEKSDIAIRYAEQKWIAYYRSDERECGFNQVKDVVKGGISGYKMTPEQRIRNKERLHRAMREHPEKFYGQPASCPRRGRPAEYDIYDPSGKLIHIYNLSKFCRDNNLKYSPMASVARNKSVEYRGWRRTKGRDPHQIEYDLTHVNGERVTGLNVAAFARSRGLCKRTMHALFTGKVKTCSGWRMTQMSKETAFTHRGKDRVLIHESGEIKTVNNIKAHCRKFGLQYESMRKGHSSRGWKFKI